MTRSQDDPGADAFAASVELHRDYVNPYWIEMLDSLGLLRGFVRGRGSWLTDHRGGEFLDFVAGFGSVTLGHNHPALRAALCAALEDEAPGFSPWGIVPEAGRLAGRLLALAGHGLGKVHFSSSGAEAVETALKLAAAKTGRRAFIVSAGGFHGTTAAATGLAGGGPWKAPFPQLWPEAAAIAPGDLAALDAALTGGGAAALIVEVIQGTGGGVTWSAPAMLEASELCRRRGALMIVDEVLTGLGRTGDWFAFQSAGPDFRPDIVVLSKGLTGGVVPVSAVLTTDEVFAATFGGPGQAKIHGSTFSGARLAMSCGLAVLDVLERENILARVERSAARLVAGLERLAADGGIGRIRGRGLALGVEILGANDSASAAPACCLELMRRGVLTNLAAHAPGFLKLTPPLILDDADVDAFLDAMQDVLAAAPAYSGSPPSPGLKS